MTVEKTKTEAEISPDTRVGRPLVHRVSRLVGAAAHRLTPTGFLERADAQANKHRERLIKRYYRRQSGEPTPSLGRRAIRAIRENAPLPLALVHTRNQIRKK